MLVASRHSLKEDQFYFSDHTLLKESEGWMSDYQYGHGQEDLSASGFVPRNGTQFVIPNQYQQPPMTQQHHSISPQWLDSPPPSTTQGSFPHIPLAMAPRSPPQNYSLLQNFQPHYSSTIPISPTSPESSYSPAYLSPVATSNSSSPRFERQTTFQFPPPPASTSHFTPNHTPAFSRPPLPRRPISFEARPSLHLSTSFQARLSAGRSLNNSPPNSPPQISTSTSASTSHSSLSVGNETLKRSRASSWREDVEPHQTSFRPAPTKFATDRLDLPTPFISKLASILKTPEYANTISWTQKGDLFVFAHGSDAMIDIFTRVFRHSSLPSFVRQLNIYGFIRLETLDLVLALEDCPNLASHGKTAVHYSAFYHPLFTQASASNPINLGFLRPKTTKKKKKVVEQGPEVEHSHNEDNNMFYMQS